MEYIKEIHISQIRELLNRQQVKLWLSPYYNNETGPCNKELQDLSNKLTKELNIENSICYEVISDLQSNALNRLKENKQFNETGIATFKVRFVNSDKKATTFQIKIKLDSQVIDLLNQVAQHLNVEPESIKLIANGKVLNEMKNNQLHTCGLKNGKMIMALLIADYTKENETGLTQKMLEETKADAAFFAGKLHGVDNHSIEIADQNGKPIYLPQHEQQALAVAMTLHEKGRAALKKNDYSLALVFFLEADKEFSVCQSTILEKVDNFALLNLDIAWTYLCLRSISHLNDVEKRLNFCEQNFKKSYGVNLERLIVLKGTIGKETALFCRLHLLQAIINFHLAKFTKAKELLELAERELKYLRVDENKVLILAELGYTMADARLALRVSHGEIIPAESYLSRKKAEKLSLAKKEDEKRKNLMQMGFNAKKINKALTKFSGNFEEALNYLAENARKYSASGSSSKHNDLPSTSNYDAMKIAEDFMRNSPSTFRNTEHMLNAAKDFFNNLPGTSSLNEASFNAAKELIKKKSDEMQKEEEAFERISEGLSTHDEDHLNLLLDAEENFLIEYKSLLEKHFTPNN